LHINIYKLFIVINDSDLITHHIIYRVI